MVFRRGIFALAKRWLIRPSPATLPTKSSTTEVMAGLPPSRSYSDFLAVMPPSMLAQPVANSTTAVRMPLPIPRIVPSVHESRSERLPYVRPKPAIGFRRPAVTCHAANASLEEGGWDRPDWGRPTPAPSRPSLRDGRLGVAQLGPLAVGTIAERDQPRVERPRLGRVSRQLCRATRAEEAVEAVRLPRRRGLELDERLPRLLEIEQHLAQQLAGRHDGRRRDGMLLAGVLEIRRRAHQRERLVVLALRTCRPRRRCPLLDVHLLGPVGLAGGAERGAVALQ